MTPTTDRMPTIPDYRLLRPIGCGAFGTVYLARNRTTDAMRAIKVIPLHSTGLDRANREIGSLRRLEESVLRKHLHLLELLHVGKTEGHLFYVMELADPFSTEPLPGNRQPHHDAYIPATLDRLLRLGPLEPQRCWKYAIALVGALACLHEAEVVHRDVKPSNCLFVGGELKLGDFGLLADSGTLISQIGTRAYMPPDGRMDTQADVYAAGLVIYEMMTGLPPDRFPTFGSSGDRISRSREMSILNRVVLTACEPERSHRFSDARSMQKEIERLRGDRSLLPSPASHRKTRVITKRYILAAMLGGAFVILVFLAAGKYKFFPFPSPPAKVTEENQEESHAGMQPDDSAPLRVNFITEPYEARVLIDGELMLQEDGTPWTTPCSIVGLDQKEVAVSFQWEEDAPIPAGTFDLTDTREICLSKENGWTGSMPQ